jgi:hypothetical protein
MSFVAPSLLPYVSHLKRLKCETEEIIHFFASFNFSIKLYFLSLEYNLITKLHKLTKKRQKNCNIIKKWIRVNRKKTTFNWKKQFFDYKKSFKENLSIKSSKSLFNYQLISTTVETFKQAQVPLFMVFQVETLLPVVRFACL